MVAVATAGAAGDWPSVPSLFVLAATAVAVAGGAAGLGLQLRTTIAMITKNERDARERGNNLLGAR